MKKNIVMTVLSKLSPKQLFILLTFSTGRDMMQTDEDFIPPKKLTSSSTIGNDSTLSIGNLKIAADLMKTILSIFCNFD